MMKLSVLIIANRLIKKLLLKKFLYRINPHSDIKLKWLSTKLVLFCSVGLGVSKISHGLNYRSILKVYCYPKDKHKKISSQVIFYFKFSQHSTLWPYNDSIQKLCLHLWWCQCRYLA